MTYKNKHLFQALFCLGPVVVLFQPAVPGVVLLHLPLVFPLRQWIIGLVLFMTMAEAHKGKSLNSSIL